MSTIKSTVETPITPELMATAFWEMDSVEQAQFFDCLRKEIAASQSRGKTYLYKLGEMQWYFVADELTKDGKITPAGEMLMAMAAPLFTHLTEWLGRDGKEIPCAFYEEDRVAEKYRAALVKIGDEKLSKYASVDDYAGFVGGVINEALGESL